MKNSSFALENKKNNVIMPEISKFYGIIIYMYIVY